MELPENYQNLVTAIIKQAVVDYRKSRLYLQKHPKTDELVEAAKWQTERRKRQQEKRRAKGLPPIPEKRNKEEELLTRILRAEHMLQDTVRFFRSDWFYALADIDGEVLLKRLEEEFE